MRQDFQTGLGHSLYCKCQSVGRPRAEPINQRRREMVLSCKHFISHVMSTQ